MSTQTLEFPFDQGAYEASDREWLPPNLFSVVENLRLDLDGRLGVRPGNTALSATTYTASAMVAFDLANYNGRLVALGDQTGQSRPTDLFELVNGAAGTWRATAGTDNGAVGGNRIPRSTAVRELARFPDLTGDALGVRCAAGSGLVVSVTNLSDSTCRVHVFNPTTDQTIILVQRPLVKANVIFDGTHFWIVGQITTSNAIVGYQYTPASDKDLTGAFTTLVAAPTGGAVIDLALAQTGASDFTIAYIPNAGTSVLAQRFNSAGTTQSTFSVVAGLTSAVAVAVCGDSGAARLGFLYLSGASASYNLISTTPAGAASVGPTSCFGGATITGFRKAAMGISGTGVMLCGMRDNGVTNDVVTQPAALAANTLQSTVRYCDAFLTAGPCPITAGGQTNFYYSCIDNLAKSVSRATNQLVEQGTRFPMCFKDPQLAGATAIDNDTGSIALLGGKLYWGNTVRSIAPRDPNQEPTGGSTGAVTEVNMSDTGRRQMTQQANELHIAGGLPMVYDGRYMAEHGFAEQPAFSVSVAQTTGGALTLLGVYNILPVWEVVDAKGNILRSQPGLPIAVTLTGSNNKITATCSTPHSFRRHPFFQVQGGYGVRLGLYRTIAGGANFQIDNFVVINTTEFGDTVACAFTQSDATLSDNAPVYTQEQTPVPHVSPASYQYSWVARERMIVGGQPHPEIWTFSKLLFPSEPVEFAPSGALGFSNRAFEDITAVGAFETVGIVWTQNTIATISGRGPEQNGTGDFDPITQIPSPGGCARWQSLVNAPPGFFFQMADEKLMLLSRNSQGTAGEVSWKGKAVQQTLALFPVITGGVFIRAQSQPLVVFSCTDVAGSAGRMLVYDLTRDVWYVDTVGPVVSVSQLNGRLAYVQGGTVFLQDVAPGSGTFVPSAVQTGFLSITKKLGWGRIYKIGLLGQDMGVCNVECFIDYDDGAGLRSLGVEAFTGTGKAFERFWSLAIQKTARFSVRFVVTSAATNSLGVRLNAWAAEVDGSANMVRVGSGGVVA